MIMKTIGFRGLANIFRHTHFSSFLLLKTLKAWQPWRFPIHGTSKSSARYVASEATRLPCTEWLWERKTVNEYEWFLYVFMS